MKVRSVIFHRKQVIATVIFVAAVLACAGIGFSIIYIHSKFACWGRLSSTAGITEVKSRSLIQAYENSLKSIANILELVDNPNDSSYLRHLNTVKLYDLNSPVRLFLKNGTAYTEDAIYDDYSEYVKFEDIVTKEPFLTTVHKDPFHPEILITEIRVPIKKNNEVIGVLSSPVNLKKLEEYIAEASTPSRAYVMILDRRDDTLVADTDHKQIININNFRNRQDAEGFSFEQFLDDVYHCKPARGAIVSLRTGKVKYLFSIPSEIPDYSVIIEMNKEILFQDMLLIKKIFIFLIIATTILFLCYLTLTYRITRKQMEEQNFEYSEIAKALSKSFDVIYFINTIDNTYKVFNKTHQWNDLQLDHQEKDFFNETLVNIVKVIHENDIEGVRNFVDKRNLLRMLQSGETSSQVYRLIINNEPVYYRMKVMRIESDKEHIVLATENVNNEVLNEQQSQLRNIKLIQALSDSYETIYYIDPITEKYETHGTNYTFNEKIIKKLSKGENFFDDLIKDVTKVIHDPDQEQFTNFFTRNNLSKTVYKSTGNYIDVRILIDYEPVWHRIKAVAVKDSNDNDRYVVGIMNISDLKKQELERSRNSEIIKILASEYSAVFYVDFEDESVTPYTLNEYTISNFERYFRKDVPYTEAFKNFVDTNVSPSDKNRLLELGSIYNIKNTLSKQKSYSVTYQGLNDGIAHYCELKIVKFGDDSDKPVDIAIGFSDRDEEILTHYVDTKLYEDYFGIYFVNLENDSVRIIKQDKTRNIVDFKSEGLFLKQMSSYSYYIHPKYKEDMLNFCNSEYLMNYLKGQDKREFTYQITNNEWRRATAFVVDRDGDTPKTLIITFMNIDDVAAQKIELTETIAEQKKALESQQILLEQALAKAEAASNAKTAFLSNMSHDIRTPMNAITGFTNLALEHIDEKEKVHNYLEKVAKSSDHLLSLINDVLDMSRIEAGKVLLDLEPENIMNIIQYVKDILSPEINLKQQKFIINTENVVHETVMCDRLRLNRILLNIISNSIKYTHREGIISIKISEADTNAEEYKSYTFEIKDNGIGMKPEFLKTIFEPFTRERNSTVSGIQGTGLGMAITKNLVDIMNGTIKIDSEEGKGTTTTITLELKITDRTKNIISKSDKHDVSFAGAKVLLVDDNDFNREIASLILTDQGIIVEEAQNGQEAYEKVAASAPGNYDLILMDVQMPIMGGYEATQKIRALENKELANIPIIAMTANAFEEDRAAAFNAGMNEHIPKPLNITKLTHTLQQYLTGQRS